MQICCDQNVASKCVRAFERAEGITITRVEDVWARGAPDVEIVDLVSRKNWLLLTSDSEFFGHECAFALLVYSPLEDPQSGDVVAAVRTIDRAHERNREFTETVPGGWM